MIKVWILWVYLIAPKPPLQPGWFSAAAYFDAATCYTAAAARTDMGIAAYCEELP